MAAKIQPCSGTERHGHYHLATGRTVFHSHRHEPQTGDTNALHHHPPAGHDGLSYTELTGNVPHEERWMWR